MTGGALRSGSWRRRAARRQRTGDGCWRGGWLG